MLGLVVLNERKDLDDTYNENSKEAFESIKSLKDVEKAILTQLENTVDELLGDESLIRTLTESKNTAEYVAARLRNIAQTSAFIQKSRDAYAPVAYRAAVLYMIVQDLSKINPLYQFSLSWFKTVFTNAMEMTNILKGDPAQDNAEPTSPASPGGKGASNPSMSVEDRISILTTTLTQEVFKRIRIAVFEDDRPLATYMVAIRVMQAENFCDPGLSNFLLRGTQKLDKDTRVPEEVNELPWMDSLMWADLKTLSTLKPFNPKNLLGHIRQNQLRWDKFYQKLGKPLTFMDLPNKDQIDIRVFTLDADELAEANQTRPKTTEGQAPDAASVGVNTAGDSNSRVASRGQMKHSESQILNDPEIWDLDSDEDFNEANSGSEQDTEGATPAEPSP